MYFSMMYYNFSETKKIVGLGKPFECSNNSDIPFRPSAYVRMCVSELKLLNFSQSLFLYLGIEKHLHAHMYQLVLGQS